MSVKGGQGGMQVGKVDFPPHRHRVHHTRPDSVVSALGSASAVQRTRPSAEPSMSMCSRIRRHREVTFEPDAEAIGRLRKLDLLGDRSRGSPVGVAQDEGHVVPDLVLAATDVQRLAALRRQRPGAQRHRPLDRLFGAEQQAVDLRRRQIVRPPSTGNSTPVMNRPASLAR